MLIVCVHGTDTTFGSQSFLYVIVANDVPGAAPRMAARSQELRRNIHRERAADVFVIACGRGFAAIYGEYRPLPVCRGPDSLRGFGRCGFPIRRPAAVSSLEEKCDEAAEHQDEAGVVRPHDKADDDAESITDLEYPVVVDFG